MFFWSYMTSILLVLTGFFMIFLVLIQRGRGGGLAGAFGGMGGQSAFGTKAGDVFTKITIVTFIVWVALAAAGGFAMRSDSGRRFKAAKSGGPDVPTVMPDTAGESTPDDSQDGSSDSENPFDAGMDAAGDTTEDAGDDADTIDTPEADTETDAGTDGDTGSDPPDSSAPAERAPAEP